MLIVIINCCHYYHHYFFFFCALADLITLYLLRELVMTHEKGPLDFDSLP